MAETQPAKLKLYDVSLDEIREPTQLDLDRMQSIIYAYGEFCKAFDGSLHAEAINERLKAKIAALEKQYDQTEAYHGPSYDKGWDDAVEAFAKAMPKRTGT